MERSKLFIQQQQQQQLINKTATPAVSMPSFPSPVRRQRIEMRGGVAKLVTDPIRLWMSGKILVGLISAFFVAFFVFESWLMRGLPH